MGAFLFYQDVYQLEDYLPWKQEAEGSSPSILTSGSSYVSNEMVSDRVLTDATLPPRGITLSYKGDYG